MSKSFTSRVNHASLAVSGNVPLPFQANVDHTFSIGRAPENDLYLPQNDWLSRFHAVIRRASLREYYLVDLGSKNGTYLNGERLVEPTVLSPGAEIAVGDVTLTFQQPEILPDPPVLSEPVELCLLILDMVLAPVQRAKLDDKSYGQALGRFFYHAIQVISSYGGWVDKFRSSRMLAYWERPSGPFSGTQQALETAIRVVQKIQTLPWEHAVTPPRVHATLHHGKASFSADIYEAGEPIFSDAVEEAFELAAIRTESNDELLVTEPCLASLPEKFLLRLHENGSMRPTKLSPSLRVFTGRTTRRIDVSSKKS